MDNINQLPKYLHHIMKNTRTVFQGSKSTKKFAMTANLHACNAPSDSTLGHARPYKVDSSWFLPFQTKKVAMQKNPFLFTKIELQWRTESGVEEEKEF